MNCYFPFTNQPSLTCANTPSFLIRFSKIPKKGGKLMKSARFFGTVGGKAAGRRITNFTLPEIHRKPGAVHNVTNKYF